MKSPFKRVLATGVLLLSSTAGAVGCSGKFMNPITDICWSCVFPITVFGKAIDKGGQLDTESGPTGVCVCNANIGIPIGFWEPVRQLQGRISKR